MNPAKLGCCRAAKVRSKVQPLISAAVKEKKLGQWHFQWHWMKALISSDYFKSTVDLRRHRSGVMKSPCVLPGFVRKYAHRSLEFSTCTNCVVSLPYSFFFLFPHGNKFDEASEARTRSTLPDTSFRAAAPKSMHQGQHLCRAAQEERESLPRVCRS